mgnify:CR=1 FL=1
MTRATLAALAGRIPFAGRDRSANALLNPMTIKTELLSGLTVALALVPEAVAFAFVAGVHPLVGLYAAFIVGLITSVFGGRPGMISGATGALAVVMVSLVASHGVEYLFATVVLMGILQVLAGVFHLGKFIRLVPHPVMLGFVNGLAIVIFLAQLTQFKVHAPDGSLQWMTGWPLVTMLGLVAATMAIIWAMPKLTSAIPAPLAGIAVVAGVVIAFGIDVPRVGDLASIEGGLPLFHLPTVPLTFETLEVIVPYAVILAAIGLIESLLTLNLVGEITGQRGGASKECVAQGAANVVTGFFGGMGGCAMIGQSMINVKSGGRTRLSGIAASIASFAFLAIVNTVYSNWEGVTGATSSVVGLTRYVDQWVSLAWAAAAIVAANLYANSASGLALRATREDEVAAAASGINMYRHRLLSLVVSGFFTGVSGALLGHSIGVLNPDSFYLSITFISLAMLVVGGIGSLSGAVIGVLSLSLLIEALVRLEQGVIVGGAEFALPGGAQEILIGIVMILILVLRPAGLLAGKDLCLPRVSPRFQPKHTPTN